MTSRCKTGNSSAGFTLIELIMVIAILGLMLVLVGVRGTPLSPGLEARAAAQNLAGALRAARAEALAANRPTAIRFDLANRSYRVGAAPAATLSGALSLALLTSRDETVNETLGNIRFYPDGSSSGGRLSVSGGGQTWWIGIDWLSGRVTLAAAP
jgi:general secretion pathway protein H